MRKLLALLAVFGMLTIGANNIYAQGGAETPDSTKMSTENDTSNAEATMTGEASDMEEDTESNESASTAAAEEAPEKPKGFHQVLKDKFIEGGVEFMSTVIICLILGLAIAIERILYLSMATTNTKKLLDEVESALNSGGVESAKEVCRNTRGPIASIFYQGLDRHEEGIDMVEKSVISYGGVQLGLMEKGVSWISLFIALAPMLGFFGTVIGMIQAFDAIAAENNISPGIVAGGIGVALITTVSGLLVAMILQIFYNYIVAKIDGLTNDMENASISLVDMIVKYQHSKK